MPTQSKLWKNTISSIIFSSLLCTSAAQTSEKVFDRSEFFINMNECLNCYIFLKNYVLTLQNSKVLVLHLDEKTRSFGKEFLDSKGIDTQLFDSIYYHDLHSTIGDNFQSFVILHNCNEVDTLLIIEPLLLKEVASSGINMKVNQHNSCGTFSNRFLIYPNDEGFVTIDDILKNSVRFSNQRSGNLSCESDPFNIEDSGFMDTCYSLLEANDIVLSLTYAMMPLFSQLGLDKTVPVTMGRGHDEKICMVSSVPYALETSSGDTALAKINILHKNNQEIFGYLDFFNGPEALPSSEGYSPFLYFGIGYYNQTVFVPMSKKGKEVYKEGDFFIGRYEKNNNSNTYDFVAFVDIFLPVDHDNSNVNIGFGKNLCHLVAYPYMWDLPSGLPHKINLNEEGSRLWIYSIEPEGINSNFFKLLYQLDGELIVSRYNRDTKHNSVVFNDQKPKHKQPVLLEDGLYLISSNLSADGYEFFPLDFAKVE